MATDKSLERFIFGKLEYVALRYYKQLHVSATVALEAIEKCQTTIWQLQYVVEISVQNNLVQGIL